jgi:hypothetical protein
LPVGGSFVSPANISGLRAMNAMDVAVWFIKGGLLLLCVYFMLYLIEAR